MQASKDVGIQVIYKCNGDLFPRLCQRHSSSQPSTVTDMEYADDAALVALSRLAVVHALTVFCDVAKEFG